MRVSYGEDLANHTGPESCGADRKVVVEALTGVRAGWVSSLEGKEKSPGFATVASLARELGVGVRLEEETDVDTIRRRQAERKAKRILAIIQGTSALEAQGLEKRTLRDMREKTINELLAGSPRRLWSD